jgi:hypothetical protein
MKYESKPLNKIIAMIKIIVESNAQKIYSKTMNL